MPFIMEKDEPFDPAYISLLGTKSMVLQAHDIAHLIQQLARFFVIIKFLIFHEKSGYINSQLIKIKKQQIDIQYY